MAIQWNTEALVKERAPDPEVQWPDTQPVFVKTKSLVSLLRLQAQACDSINLSSEDFASLKDGLSGCSTLLSEALNQLLADVQKITQDTNATIENVLGSLQPELSDRAAQVRKRLANKEEVCPKREAIDLLKANEELLAGKVMRVCASVKGLEQLAPYLPTEAQHSLEVKARHLAIHLRTEEIERLLQDTEARTEEPRRVRQRIKEAAQQLLDFLTEIEVKSLSSELIDRVEEAVREGDGDRATSIISCQESFRPQIDVFSIALNDSLQLIVQAVRGANGEETMARRNSWQVGSHAVSGTNIQCCTESPDIYGGGPARIVRPYSAIKAGWGGLIFTRSDVSLAGG